MVGRRFYEVMLTEELHPILYRHILDKKIVLVLKSEAERDRIHCRWIPPLRL